MSHLENKRRELALLRATTERIRKDIHSDSLESYVTPPTQVPKSQAVYYAIHGAYFSKNSKRMHHADGEYGHAHASWFSDEDYARNTGARRTCAVEVGGFLNINKELLPQLEDKLFSAIEVVLTRGLQKEDVSLAMAIIEDVLLICHFPFDGSGRTGEDFLVWFAHQFSFPFTISSTGYRGFIEEGYISRAEKLRIQFRKNVQWISAREVIRDRKPEDERKVVRTAYTDTILINLGDLLREQNKEKLLKLRDEKLLKIVSVLCSALEMIGTTPFREILPLLGKNRQQIQGFANLFWKCIGREFTFTDDSYNKLLDYLFALKLGSLDEEEGYNQFSIEMSKRIQERIQVDAPFFFQRRKEKNLLKKIRRM